MVKKNLTIKYSGVWVGRIFMLTILYMLIWGMGTLIVAGQIPDQTSEPGLADGMWGLLILSVINTLLIVSLIVSSRWHGWRLAVLLGMAYYGSFTVITQIETWYFLTGITVSGELLLALFLMGLPVPFIYIPLAILICGRWKPVRQEKENMDRVMSTNQFLLKLVIIAFGYLLIYWCAGYYIAWQNPELRTFYGSPGEITPFWEHTLTTFKNEPGLILLQLGRGILFVFIAIPVIRGSMVNPWLTACLVGLLLSIPHLVHILPNPFIPLASVRFSHMIETVTSNFLFGLFIAWLLRRRHQGGKNWMGQKMKLLPTKYQP